MAYTRKNGRATSGISDERDQRQARSATSGISDKRDTEEKRRRRPLLFLYQTALVAHLLRSPLLTESLESNPWFSSESL